MHRPSRIQLFRYPRILGFVFNPLSIYYCYGDKGEIGAIVYEVRNTFGEHHAYVALVGPGPAGRAGVRRRARKRFQVSPFIAMAADRRRAFTDRQLLNALVRFPHMTLEVVAAIYFEALRLWAKGIRLVERQRAPEPLATTVVLDAGSGVKRPFRETAG